MGDEQKDQTKMNNWDQTRLIQWIRSIPTSNISEKIKTKIINGITKYAEENDMEISGKDLGDAEKDDIKEICGINGIEANKLLEEIEAQKDSEFEGQNNGGGGGRFDNDDTDAPFDLNFVGAQNQSLKLKNVRKTMKIREVKSLYLIEFGDEISAHKYANDKWGKDEKEKISLKYNGKPMVNDKTLQYYDCTDGLLPVCVVFRVKGGAEQKYEKGTEKELQYAPDDKDRFRKRKLKYRKYKQIILSKDPDCIMGYTDADGIKRAQMPCGCAIASDTCFRYMKSTFEKDFKAVNMYCPMPKNICKGTKEQRHWKWSLIFIVADLSQNEINKFSRVINNRKSGSKSCPHCSCITERPDNLRIWRVNCTQCNNSDWCWQCLKVWKGSGWGSICGNDGCLGDKLNFVLAQKNYIDPKKSNWVKEGEQMPDMRACPKCLTLIEYTHACQHMTCLGCPHEFCFKCIKPWKDSSGNGIHNYDPKVCVIAKIQEFK